MKWIFWGKSIHSKIWRIIGIHRNLKMVAAFFKFQSLCIVVDAIDSKKRIQASNRYLGYRHFFTAVFPANHSRLSFRRFRKWRFSIRPFWKPRHSLRLSRKRNHTCHSVLKLQHFCLSGCTRQRSYFFFYRRENLNGRFYAGDHRSGWITSPYFPNNYPMNTDCVWVITLQSGKRVKVSFKFFITGQ